MSKIKQRDLDDLENEFKKKLRKFKDRISDCESKLENLNKTIKKEVNFAMKMKMKRMILQEVGEETKGISKKVLRIITNGYLDFINRIAEHQAKVIIERNIIFDSQIIKDKNCTSEIISRMYEDGWKLVYSGKLTDEGESIYLFDKPRLSREAKKKKVKRSPV